MSQKGFKIYFGAFEKSEFIQ
uniref:Uncharacterized protein n=1 Tax=Anguilla anguilla TaxID=7936 RepID=A0A0E9RH18_ANGAN